MFTFHFYTWNIQHSIHMNLACKHTTWIVTTKVSSDHQLPNAHQNIHNLKEQCMFIICIQ